MEHLALYFKRDLLLTNLVFARRACCRRRRRRPPGGGGDGDCGGGDGGDGDGGKCGLAPHPTLTPVNVDLHPTPPIPQGPGPRVRGCPGRAGEWCGGGFPGEWEV